VTRFNDEARFLDETDPRYTSPALEAMEYLAGEGVPFEINCGAVNRGRKKELYPRRELLRALHDFGGQILISSDAHQKELLDGGFDVAVRTAIDCGFTHVNYLAHDAQGKIEVRQVALDGLY
jgi:histidinol-phosphatase (PHP family)